MVPRLPSVALEDDLISRATDYSISSKVREPLLRARKMGFVAVGQILRSARPLDIQG